MKHRYQVLKNPDAPNLRQVHLMHEELFDELWASGFIVQPSTMGENVTTRGVELLALPRGARLRLGDQAVIVGHRLQADRRFPAGVDNGSTRAGQRRRSPRQSDFSSFRSMRSLIRI